MKKYKWAIVIGGLAALSFVAYQASVNVGSGIASAGQSAANSIDQTPGNIASAIESVFAFPFKLLFSIASAVNGTGTDATDQTQEEDPSQD